MKAMTLLELARDPVLLFCVTFGYSVFILTLATVLFVLVQRWRP